MNEVNSIPVVSLRIKEDSKLYAEEPISNAEDAVKIFTKAIYKDLGGSRVLFIIESEYKKSTYQYVRSCSWQLRSCID